MSGDLAQKHFADGLTEDIITGLSRQQWFSVARNSSFAFKGEAIDVHKVASELGVRYVLEGSVRKAANRVRIALRLCHEEPPLDQLDRVVLSEETDLNQPVILMQGPAARLDPCGAHGDPPLSP